MNALKSELKELLVDCLALEDVTAESISDDIPLFGDEDGLNLDSIDALELAVALSKKYGVTIKSEDDNAAGIFKSVASLADYVAAHRSST